MKPPPTTLGNTRTPLAESTSSTELGTSFLSRDKAASTEASMLCRRAAGSADCPLVVVQPIDDSRQSPATEPQAARSILLFIGSSFQSRWESGHGLGRPR